jgi:hypothetical protein
MAQPAEQRVADASTDEVELVSGTGEQVPETIDHRSDPEQLGDRLGLRTAQPGLGHAGQL